MSKPRYVRQTAPWCPSSNQLIYRKTRRFERISECPRCGKIVRMQRRGSLSKVPPHRVFIPRDNPISTRSLRSIVIGEIPGRIEKIFYHRYGPGVSRDMRGPYQHGFKSSARILALADGSLLIKPTKSGRKLWVRLPH